MDCFLKKIFEGKSDELVHGQFQKFSRGIFKQRALIKATRGAKGYSLSMGPEYANELVRVVAGRLGSKSTLVTGVVVSTTDLKQKLPYSDIKQFMGIKQYVINGEMTGEAIENLVETIPEAFFALSFSAGETVLKIKPKAPKSAKPRTSEEPVKPDFCSLKTQDTLLVSLFVFNPSNSEWKTFEAGYTYEINDIELPSGVSDPNEIRRLAKRKGTIVQNAKTDGKEQISRKPFIA